MGNVMSLTGKVACMAVLCVSSAVAQAAAPAVKRTADGHPDLQGVWTSATLTRLERPEEFGNRLALTDVEVKKIEGTEADFVANAAKPSDVNKANPDCTRFQFGCGYNNFWIDRGSKVIAIGGEKRSSIITDPANGKLPPLVDARRKELAASRRTHGDYDGPEARPVSDRCLLAFGSSSGPPMLPVLYNNHYQIVQSKETVVILVEMVHDVRVVRIGGKHLPPSMSKWMGDSIGHWEGDTLVVETTNFRPEQSFRGATTTAKITERFTRTANDMIDYKFTVEDPAAFTHSFSGEMPFYATEDRIFEYACHEGNYALLGILAGAREAEKRGERPRGAERRDDE
jgi:hypothetical protein